MEPETQTVDWQKIVERLRDPVQLRVFITSLMLAVGYLGIYMPLHDRIEETTRALNAERKRQDLAKKVENLRAEVDKVQGRVPDKTDTNEWIQYLLVGVRRYPVKLLNLDSKPEHRLSPFTVVAFHVELEGEFFALDSFLHWVEANDRLFRVDSTRVTPSRNGNDMRVMDLTLLGVKS